MAAGETGGGFFLDHAAQSTPWAGAAKIEVLPQSDIDIKLCMHGSIACFFFLSFLLSPVEVGMGLVWGRSKNEWLVFGLCRYIHTYTSVKHEPESNS